MRAAFTGGLQQSLADLSDQAFGAVENGVIPAPYAAEIGRAIHDPAQQLAAISALARAEPANVQQARIMVSDLVNAGFLKDRQTSLFGEEEVSRSLIRERARVLDGALRQLEGSRRTFGAAIRGENRLSEAGNVMAGEANRAGKAANEAAIERLRTEATTHGPVSDQLNAAARELAGGGKLGDVTGRFLATFREADRGAAGDGAQPGDAAGGGGRAGRPDDAGPGHVAGAEESVAGRTLLLPDTAAREVKFDGEGPNARAIASNGSTEFGRVPDGIPGVAPGPIVLLRGNHAPGTDRNFGLAHIEAQRGDEIRKRGFDNVAGFVEDIAHHYDEIRSGKTSGLLLVKKEQNPASSAYGSMITVMLHPNGDGSYSVGTALRVNNKYLNNTKLLWSSTQQIDTGFPELAAPSMQPSSEVSSQTAPWAARGQSNDENISPPDAQRNTSAATQPRTVLGPDAIIERLHTQVNLDVMRAAKDRIAGRTPIRQLSREAVNDIHNFIDFIGRRLFTDLGLRLRSEPGSPLGSYDAANHVVTIYRRAIERGQVTQTTIHELWHSLEGTLPENDRQALIGEWQKARDRWLADNPAMKPLLDDAGHLAGVIEGDAAADWVKRYGDTGAASLVRITRDTAGTPTEVRFRPNADTYRYMNPSEWFAETMTDRYLADRDSMAARPRSILESFRDVILRVVDGVKRFFGGDVGGRVFEGFRNGDYAVPQEPSPPLAFGSRVFETPDLNRADADQPHDPLAPFLPIGDAAGEGLHSGLTPDDFTNNLKRYLAGEKGANPVRINLERNGTTEEIKDTLARVSTMIEAPEVKHDDALAAAAAGLGMTPETMITAFGNKLPSDTEMLAMKAMLDSSAAQLIEYARLAVDPNSATPAAKAQAVRAFAAHMEIQVLWPLPREPPDPHPLGTPQVGLEGKVGRFRNSRRLSL